MNPKTRDKIKSMIQSDDIEMRALGEILFWDKDPLYEDFKIVEDSKSGKSILDCFQFYRLKSKGRVFVHEVRKYIYRPDTLPKNSKV